MIKRTDVIQGIIIPRSQVKSQIQSLIAHIFLAIVCEIVLHSFGPFLDFVQNRLDIDEFPFEAMNFFASNKVVEIKGG